MDRRSFLARTGLALLATSPLLSVGCRSNKQIAHILEPDSKDMVGSHTAGAETWKPLVDESVSKLLGRQIHTIQQVSHEGHPDVLSMKKRVCFLGVENKSGEELGDFKEQIYEYIDSQVNCSEMFQMINRRFVESGLHQAKLGPGDLFVPGNMRAFSAVMEQLQSPVDYLLYAKVTSGTTTKNDKNYQRDYLLTLEMVNVHTGNYDKESASLRKGYHKSRLGKMASY